MSARLCTQCGAEVFATDKFCSVCGAAQEQTAEAKPVAPAESSPRSTTGPTKRAPQPRSRLPVIALSVLGLIALLAVAFGLYRAFNNAPESIEEIVARQVEEGLPYPEVLRVSAADAKASFDTEGAIFVDVRDPESYAAAHVPGAVLLPLTEFAAGYTQLPQNAEIITYCT